MNEKSDALGALAPLLGHAFEAEHWDGPGTERELF